MLKLFFLGKVNIEKNGENIFIKLGNKTAMLIALLMIQKNGSMSREKLFSYLWPDSNEDAAKGNLRYNLWKINKIVGKDKHNNALIESNKEFYTVNGNYDFFCDIFEIESVKNNRISSIEELERLFNLLSGEFMEGCYFGNCDEINETIIAQRRLLENKKIMIMRSLVDAYEKDLQIDKALTLLQELIILEPYDEFLASCMIKLYSKKGQRGAAIDFYHSFTSRLACNLGIEPSNDLINVYNKIKNYYENSKEFLLNKSENKDDGQLEYTIHTYCAKIDCYLIADLIGKLLDFNIYLKNYIADNCIRDLAFIQPRLGETDQIIPIVRVVESFLSFISSFCKKNKLTIYIENRVKMDDVSLEVLECLMHMHLSNLNIHYIS